MKFFFKLTFISFFLLTNTNAIEIKINKLGDLKKIGDAVKKQISKEKEQPKNETNETNETNKNENKSKISLEQNKLLLSKNILDKMIISYELKSTDGSSIEKKNYNVAARVGWFSNEYWYTFKVDLNYLIKTDDNSYKEFFSSPVLYNMKFSNNKNDEFNIDKGFFVYYDRNSFDISDGNYNFLQKENENNYSFKLDFDNSNIIYLRRNKSLDFETRDKVSFIKELEGCQKNYLISNSKEILNNYENCKIVYSKITNYLIQDGKIYVANISKQDDQKIANQNYQKLKFDNASYLGEVKDGLPNGYGKAEYKNGNIYEGNFQNGQRTGQGKLMLISGDGTKTYDVIEGQFLNGKIVKGKATFVRGDRMMYYGVEYEGEFKDDVPHGKGKKTYVKDLHPVTGKFYEGGFKEGKEHGNGLLTTANGDVYRVKFKNGELVDKEIYKKNPKVLQ